MNRFDRFAAALEAEELAEQGASAPQRRQRGRPRRGTAPEVPPSGLVYCGAQVDAETHAALKRLAKADKRSMASLCRVIFDAAIAGKLVVSRT